MAFDWGTVGAGFIKGFADDQGMQIRAQQEEDAMLRKAKLLEDLRASTEERMLKLREAMEARRTDSQLSGADGDDMVYRDRDGQEKSRRALTADEREARDNARRSADLANRKGEQDILASQASIRQGDERNSLTRRGQDLEAQANRERNAIARLGSQGNNGGISSGSSSTQIGYQLTEINSAAVEQAMKDDKVPREEIQRMATFIAAQELAKGRTDVEVMNNAFLVGLRELRKGAEGTGNDRVWSISEFNKKRNSR